MLGAAVGNGAAAYPPTPAMKRFADSLVRQKGIKPPPGYKTSISICRKFLSEHAPKKADGETPGKLEPKPVSPAQLLYAKKIAQGKGLVIPDEAKASSAAMSAWIEFEPRQQAPQARSQDFLQVGWFGCASIGGAEKEVSETQSWRRCRSVDSRPAKFGGRDTTADSLRQQGSRAEAWRPLWLGRMVRAARSRSFCFRRARMAVTPGDCPLRHLLDGRDRGAEGILPGNLAADWQTCDQDRLKRKE